MLSGLAMLSDHYFGCIYVCDYDRYYYMLKLVTVYALFLKHFILGGGRRSSSSTSSNSSKHHGSNESTDGSCSTRKPVDRHTCHGYSL